MYHTCSPDDIYLDSDSDAVADLQLIYLDYIARFKHVNLLDPLIVGPCPCGDTSKNQIPYGCLASHYEALLIEKNGLSDIDVPIVYTLAKPVMLKTVVLGYKLAHYGTIKRTPVNYGAKFTYIPSFDRTLYMSGDDTSLKDTIAVELINGWLVATPSEATKNLAIQVPLNPENISVSTQQPTLVVNNDVCSSVVDPNARDGILDGLTSELVADYVVHASTPSINAHDQIFASNEQIENASGRYAVQSKIECVHESPAPDYSQNGPNYYKHNNRYYQINSVQERLEVISALTSVFEKKVIDIEANPRIKEAFSKFILELIE